MWTILIIGTYAGVLVTVTMVGHSGSTVLGEADMNSCSPSRPHNTHKVMHVHTHIIILVRVCAYEREVTGSHSTRGKEVFFSWHRH